MDDDDVWQHEAGWGADARHVALARTFASRCLAQHLVGEGVDNVPLVVSELATNAVVHAATAFTLSLALVDEVLTVTVHDGSATLPHPYAQPAPMGSSGRGLLLVAALSVTWGVTRESDGKAVWATFDVHPTCVR